MNSDDKMRPFYLAKILYDQTDEDHFLTTKQLIDALAEQNCISTYRATIESDIELLIKVGMDIEKIKSTQNKYHLVSRDFDIPELKLLIDAVESSKFITKAKSEALVAKLGTLAGKNKANELRRNLAVDGRIKSDNERIYIIVDAINDAINAGKKISFQTVEYNAKKEKILHNEGEVYIFSPFSLVWDGDNYYVVGYSDKHQEVGCHRVDRIFRQPVILEDNIVPAPKGFDINDYINSMFRMYNSPRRDVELICDNSVIDGIIDKFGSDIQIYENDTTSFRVVANIAVSHIFYSWVFGFDGKVKIKAPEDVKNTYFAMVKKASEQLLC